jgi:hypothetical protein
MCGLEARPPARPSAGRHMRCCGAQYDILDVKATNWHDAFNQFKTGLRVRALGRHVHAS